MYLHKVADFACCDTSSSTQPTPKMISENRGMDANQYPAIIRQAEPNKVPEGELVAYFQDRQQLQEALTRLLAANFPMQTLFIVGRNITQVEYFGGKLTYPRVILSSAASGAFFGALIGLVTALFTGTEVLPHLITSVPLGIAIWVLTGLFGFARAQNRNGRALTMRGQTIPGSLELRAHQQTASQARNILGVGPESSRIPAHLPGPSAAGQAPDWDKSDPGKFVGPEYNRDGSKAGGKFGLRITDPQEYAQALRPEPAPASNNERIEAIRAEQKQGRYGLKVEDPEEFEASLRKPPASEAEPSTSQQPDSAQQPEQPSKPQDH